MGHDERAASADEEADMAGQYYFCLEHRTVEREEGCRAADRLGPYDSEAEAARALEKVQERNESWDNDPRWNDDAAEG